MGALDFLFGGKPPPSVTSYGTTTQNIPQWLSDYTQGLVGKANAVAAVPYTPYQGPRVARQTADQNRAQQMVRDNAGAYTPAMQAALSRTQGIPGEAQGGFDAGNAALDASGSTTAGAIAPGKGGLSSAMPWLAGASGQFTGDTVNQYMNPYVNNVIGQATLAANRNFRESIMPQLSDTFTSNGQFGSSRHMEEADRAGRDLTEGLQTNALGALGQAYESGRGAFGTDMSRFAGLAGTAGSLGNAQQGAELQAGQQMEQLGMDYGSLAGQQGQLGLSSAAQSGTQAMDLQNMGYKDSAALAASGGDQQAQGQRSLDQAYQDFTSQRDYGKNQLDWMNSIIRGVPYDQQSSANNTGPASSYGPSLAGQLGSLYSIYKGVTTKARGGLMRAHPRYFARGGLVALEA